MAKELRCSDVMPGCDFVMKGKDENEVMSKATEHAQRDHGMSAIPADVAEKARSVIRETQ